MKKFVRPLILALVICLSASVVLAEDIELDNLSVTELSAIIRKAHNAILIQETSFEDKDVIWNEPGNVIIKIQSVELENKSITFTFLIINDSSEFLRYSDFGCSINGWRVSTASNFTSLNAYEKTKGGLLIMPDISEAEIDGLEQIDTMSLSVLIQRDDQYNIIHATLTYSEDEGLVVVESEWAGYP